ncbi:conserved hypothetical protein [Methylobacterium sp. 4-46]|uniref:DUF6949 family protein n=1 Tax=unclassified Methylobacterium TaxID=2615210 RepID=UPI000152C566|nr:MULTISPECIES: hypothetical protein [Methylobacterium]ACA16861.1 conserved hypothetical protein [Methylobacterium sp. 4-46]WFT82552.1 hypothetical protein QA634_12175 [Methylobacterium nodulans]
MNLTPTAIENLQTLVLGLAFAGLLANGFECVTARRASFSLLQGGGVAALASLPLLAFGAPFIILRNTVRGRRLEGRPIPFVMVATMIACGWSLLSGRLVLDIAQLVARA